MRRLCRLVSGPHIRPLFFLSCFPLFSILSFCCLRRCQVHPAAAAGSILPLPLPGPSCCCRCRVHQAAAAAAAAAARSILPLLPDPSCRCRCQVHQAAAAAARIAGRRKDPGNLFFSLVHFFNSFIYRILLR